MCKERLHKTSQITNETCKKREEKGIHFDEFKLVNPKIISKICS